MNYIKDVLGAQTVINFQFQASEELEDRESLAVIAAQEGQEDSNETIGPDGETFMEKYTRGVSAVETILTLDRQVLRQTRQIGAPHLLCHINCI